MNSQQNRIELVTIPGQQQQHGDANGLTLGSANHDLFVQLDTVVIPKRDLKKHQDFSRE